MARSALPVLLAIAMIMAMVHISSARMATTTTTPPTPDITETYETNCSITVPLNGRPTVMNGSMSSDLATQTNRWDISAPAFAATNEFIVQFGETCVGNTRYQVQNGQCRKSFSKEYECFSSFFKFAKYSNYTGVKTLDDGTNTKCNLWSAAFPGVNLTLCVDLNNANTPIEFSIQKYNAITRNVHLTVFRYYTWTPKSSVEIIPEPSCFTTPYSCPLSPVEDRTVWRLHSKEDYTLTNKNVADLTGDAVFLCIFVNQNSTDFLDNSLFSSFNISMNTTWSQYSLCNVEKGSPGGYSCFGAAGQPSQVGREAAYGALPQSGQCSAVNKDIGEWYSLLDSANTPSGWVENNRIKSINASCILSEELRQVCKQFPYTKADKVLRASFAKCGDVPPPSEPPHKQQKGSSSEREDPMAVLHEKLGVNNHYAHAEEIFSALKQLPKF